MQKLRECKGKAGWLFLLLVILLVLFCAFLFLGDPFFFFAARPESKGEARGGEASALAEGIREAAESPAEAAKESLTPLKEAAEAPEILPEEDSKPEIEAKLREALDSFQTEVLLYTRDTEYLKEILGKLQEEPRYFFLDSPIQIQSSSKGTSRVCFNSSCRDPESMQKEIDWAAEEILDLIPDGADDYSKAKVIYDALLDRIRYDDSLQNYDLYHALVEGSCVCEGYAKAFRYLGELAGLEMGYYTGIGSGRGNSDLHAWNSAILDGELYYFDLTWDDQEEDSFGDKLHLWFAVPYDDFIGSHTPDIRHPMAASDASENNYFYREGQVLHGPNESELMQMLLLDTMRLEIYCENQEGYDYLLSVVSDPALFSPEIYASGKAVISWHYIDVKERNAILLQFE